MQRAARPYPSLHEQIDSAAQFEEQNWVLIYSIDKHRLGHGYNSATNFFGFSSEVRYWFEYSGAATLDFTGDDDVFVFKP